LPSRRSGSASHSISPVGCWFVERSRSTALDDGEELGEEALVAGREGSGATRRWRRRQATLVSSVCSFTALLRSRRATSPPVFASRATTRTRGSASANRPPTFERHRGSTRVPGSVWPPGTKGCCRRAVAPTRSRRPSARPAPAVMMPLTSGGDAQSRLRFPYFDAVGGTFSPYTTRLLPSTGFTHAFGDARPGRVVLDEVTEELVGSASPAGRRDCRGRTRTQPPVGRVERVRVVRAAQETAGSLDLLLELVLPVVVRCERARRVRRGSGR